MRLPWTRWKLALRWLMAVALLSYFVLDAIPQDEEETKSVPSRPTEKGPKISGLKPVEVSPGGATVITVEGLDPNAPAVVTLSGDPAEIIHRRGDQIVVRIPDDADRERLKVRVAQHGKRSKGRDVWIESISREKVVRSLLGGLALIILGLRTLARALRGYTGQTLREAFSRLTRTTLRGAALGFAAGGVMQSTVSAAGVLCGMLQSRLIGGTAALAALMGAQAGSLAIVLLLPLSSGSDSILLVALGVAWLVLSEDRRIAAASKAALGIGLLFYGLHLLRVGFQPLVADPTLLPYAGYLQSDTLLGPVLCALVGVVLAAVLQGPGPLFVVVLGVTQSTGILGLTEALALLAGSGLGGALGTTVVAWPFGTRTRRLALGHIVIGAAATTLMLVGVPLFVQIAESLVPGDPDRIAYGKKVLLPNMALHLSVAYALAHVFVYLPLLFAVTPVARMIKAQRAVREETPSISTETLSIGDRFARVVQAMATALDGCLQMLRSGDRSIASHCEEQLQRAKSRTEALITRLADMERATTQNGRAELACAFSLVACRNDIGQIQRSIEGAMEAAVRLQDGEVEQVQGLHELVVTSLRALEELLSDGRDDLEQARAQEIHINAYDHEARAELLERLNGAKKDTSRAVHVTGLLAAYESLGNHLYQAREALAQDKDADLY